MTLVTPFEQVLDTNHIPSAEEQNKLRALIRDPEERLRTIEEEIARLQSKRDELKHFVDRHRALLSPFRRLPADVWREIFVFCLPNNKLGLCTRTTLEAPLLLTIVCRSWRSIAMSTPRLWNAIHIFLPVPRPGVEGERFLSVIRARNEGLRRWLQKSGSLPLTISISTEPYNSTDSNTDVIAEDPGNLKTFFHLRGEFLDILIRYCHRWKNIAFGDAAHWHFTPAFERLTPADVPRLETVLTLGNVFLWRFLPGTDDRIRVPSALGRLLAAAPRLRTLHITDECISEQTLHALAPEWSRLTELSISPPVALDFNAGRAVQTLAKTCRSVVSFSLDCAAYPGTSFDGAPDPPIEWPSIRKFAITLRNVERHPEHPTFIPEIVEIFDSVSLPSLEDFSASLFGRLWELHPPAMIFSVPWEGLLLRSQPSSITKLRLYFPAYLEPIAVLRSLQPLVGLKSLRAGNDYFGGAEEAQLLSSFAESAKYTSEELFAASLPELPELEECEFDGCVQENVEGLLDLAMRRGPKLRILRAHFMVTTGVNVEAFMPSEQVVQDRDVSGSSEEGKLTGYVHGVKLVWTWRAQNDMSHDMHDAGMPGTTHYW